MFISTISPSSSFKESKLEQAITVAAMKLASLRNQGGVPSGPTLDVRFLMPGKHDKPGFNGMRMSDYDPKHGNLYFERAVPEELIESQEAEQFVALVLEDVIFNAAEYLNEINVEFDLFSWKKALTKI